LIFVERGVARPAFEHENGVREKNEFVRRFNLNWAVQMSRKKYFAWPRPQINAILCAVPPRFRGAYRDRHGRRVRDAVDALAAR
jgi:hypothetical protein